MGKIYSGSGWSQSIIGEFEGRYIYRGNGWSKEIVAEYDERYIYRSNGGWSRDIIGEYDERYIYRSNGGWSRDIVGEYDERYIYRSNGGWSRDIVGEYEGAFGGAAAGALLLLVGDGNTNTVENNYPEREASSSSSNATGNSNAGGCGCSPNFLLIIIGILFGIFIVCRMCYSIYSGEMKWNGVFYALFFDCIISFIITNIVVYSKYMFAIDIKEENEDLIKEGLAWFLGLCAGISYIIYVIEMMYSQTATMGLLLLGIIIAPVNVAFFVIPFALAELIVLVVVRKRMKKMVEKRLKGENDEY